MKMKNIYKIAFFASFLVLNLACNKSDDITAPPPRPYADVYPEDLMKIEDFLDTHYVTVDADYNTTFTEIEDGGTETPISQMPELLFKEVNTHDITYKVYYLKLREGSGENLTRVDSAFVAYKGNTFYKSTKDVNGAPVEYTEQTIFDQRVNPVWFALEDVIRGWGEIIPEFKTGTYTVYTDGSFQFNNYGAGVMFLPSGLGYYNQGTGNINPYSPLIFNFKLYNYKYRDHDLDGILSNIEYGTDFGTYAIDTDGDELPDYLDKDDDGDGVLTKTERIIYNSNGEITYDVDGNILRYDFNNIPDCSGDTTTPTRLKRHLDPSCSK